MNPYIVLGVPHAAENARIRRAYLDAVREAPPETHPVRFKEISTAYEKIKDEPSRCRYELFDMQCTSDTPLDAFLVHTRLSVRATPLPFEAMKEFLRSCTKT